jgi:anti-sigma factor ChrR (cupin superfamily)
MQQPDIRLRMDFTKFEVVDTAALVEVPAPVAGITRRMIERDGGEVARATSIVRYEAGGRFPRHTHDLGEEILVLTGTFADEHGSYPAGTYLRNPAGSSHQPYTDDGCELFVKLRHLDLQDQQRLVVDTSSGTWHPGSGPGLQNMLLGGFGSERTVLVRWAPGTQVPPHTHATVEETLVLSGELQDEFHRYPAGTWFRAPRGSTHAPFSTSGALILIKIGHVREA